MYLPPNYNLRYTVNVLLVANFSKFEIFNFVFENEVEKKNRYKIAVFFLKYKAKIIKNQSIRITQYSNYLIQK